MDRFRKTPHASVAEFNTWASRRLPHLNSKIDSGDKAAIHSLVGEGQHFFGNARGETLPAHDAPWIPDYFAGTCVLYTSLVVHNALSHAPFANDLMETNSCLGTRFGVPPRDSNYTYVLWNDPTNSRYRTKFTEHPEEHFFLDTTRKTTLLYAQTAAHLSAIDNWFTSNEPLSNAIRALGEATRLMRGFSARDPVTGQPNLTREFFQYFKKYFPTFEVDGTPWEPPTGANSPQQWELDFVLGVADDAYRNNVAHRMRYLSSADATRIGSAMKHPGLLRTFLDFLGHKPDDDVSHLSSSIAAPDIRHTATLLTQLYKQLFQVSGSHFAQVRAYASTPEKRESNVMQHSEVARIMRMRRTIPQLQLLDDALKQLPRNERSTSAPFSEGDQSQTAMHSIGIE